MQQTLTCDRVVKAGGRVTVTWSDGTGKEFSSVAQAQAYADGLDVTETEKRAAIRRYLAADPNVNNPALMEGHSITFNDGINNMVVVS